MTREAQMPLVSDESASPDLREQYTHVAAAMGRVPNLARVIAGSEKLFGPFLGLAGAIAMDGKLPMDLKELAVMRTSELNGCVYCKGMHGPIMRSIGMDEKKIGAVTDRQIASGIFSDKELVVLNIADEMTEKISASPALVKKARGLLGDEATMELLMTVAFYNLMNRLAETSGVPLEE
ncbi:MAG: carboxymuconolactone decarboxylase family protein [Polyangiaceae bacterium]